MQEVIAGDQPHTYTVYLVRRGVFKVTFPLGEGESRITLRLNIINRPRDHPRRVPTTPLPPLLTDAELAAGPSPSSSPVPTSDPDEIPLVMPAALRIATRQSHRSPSRTKDGSASRDGPIPRMFSAGEGYGRRVSKFQGGGGGGGKSQRAPMSPARRRASEEAQATASDTGSNGPGSGESSVDWDGILRGLQAHRDDRTRRYAAILNGEEGASISPSISPSLYTAGALMGFWSPRHSRSPSPGGAHSTVEVNLDLEQLATGIPYTVTTACVSEACDAPTPPPTPSSSTTPSQATSVEYFLAQKTHATPLPRFPGHPGVSVRLEKAPRRWYEGRDLGLGVLLARCNARARRMFWRETSNTGKRSGST
ncbi:hypothetical protein BV25DRAFT_1912794 [Artomyces pyxidatus]|uniref:Uncharacterized protein n=1 Tax=Artomyces pyxidatus TaxID=48021 RepID=A0ACB8TE85_9AGAM|nr:hypothetical protein BV25DRAFT_1912794 [Artomyces pyxidatus]